MSWIELIPDPEFDNPAAWNIAGTGGAVTGGQLVFTLANVIAATPVPSLVPVIGDEYEYRIDIDSVSAFGLTARAHFGGVDIWEKADGAGVFTGDVIATDATGLVFQALPAMYAVNSASIVADAMGFESLQTAANETVIGTFELEIAALYNGSTSVDGIFSKDYVDAGGASNVDFESSTPAFVCQAADVPAIARDDTFVINGTTYSVTGIEPDGTGLVVMKLRTN